MACKKKATDVLFQFIHEIFEPAKTNVVLGDSTVMNEDVSVGRFASDS